MHSSEILIGTSGFSYEDWRGYFYPQRLSKENFLKFYSQHFKTTEINSTYYRIPSIWTVRKLMEKVIGRDDFVFSVKANQIFTHQRYFEQSDVRKMKEVLKEFDGKLGIVLFQFPHSFHKTEESKEYVKRLRDIFSDFDVAFEFRSYEWLSDDVFYMLENLDAGFVCVDEPRIKGLLPPVAVATTKKFAYIRFHGRNAKKWYEHEKPEERYDYLYTKEELKEWAEKIKKLSVEKIYIYFNNHPRAQAVSNAKMMEELLLTVYC
jgi:uncharacterized protein YecE (DUF72 family)